MPNRLKEHTKQSLAYGCFVMTAAWVAINFFFLCAGEEIVIREPNAALRMGEFAFSLAVLAFAVERSVNYIKKARRRHG